MTGSGFDAAQRPSEPVLSTAAGFPPPPAAGFPPPPGRAAPGGAAVPPYVPGQPVPAPQAASRTRSRRAAPGGAAVPPYVPGQPVPAPQAASRSRSGDRTPRVPRTRAATKSTGPDRRVVVGAVAAALVGGAVFGLVIGVFAPVSLPEPTVDLAVDASPSTTNATATPTIRPSRSAGASPSTSINLVTQRLAGMAPPQDRIENPEHNPALRFVRIDDLWYNDQGRIILRLTPLLSNGQVRSHAESIEVSLRQDATIFGEFHLGDHTNVQVNRFWPDDAFRLVRGALDHGKTPTVWIMREYIFEGSAVYLSEQAPPENQR